MYILEYKQLYISREEMTKKPHISGVQVEAIRIVRGTRAVGANHGRAEKAGELENFQARARMKQEGK